MAVCIFYRRARHDEGTPRDGLRFMALLAHQEWPKPLGIYTPCVLAAYPDVDGREITSPLVSIDGHVTGYENANIY